MGDRLKRLFELMMGIAIKEAEMLDEMKAIGEELGVGQYVIPGFVCRVFVEHGDYRIEFETATMLPGTYLCK